MNSTTSFLNRYWRILLFLIALGAFFWFVWNLLNVLLPFIIGLILAYLLLPVIQWIERKLPRKNRLTRVKRITLILLIYLIVLAIIVIILFNTVPLILDSVSQFITNLPQIISSFNTTLQNLLESLRRNVPPQIMDEVNNYLGNIGNTIIGAVQSGLGTGFTYLTSTLGFILGFVSLPVFLFFLLKDAEKLTADFYASFSPWLREHIRGVVTIFSLVLGKYIRATLLLGLVVGTLDFIGLTIMGIPYAPALALWAGLTEMIPILGPWLGAVAGVIVTMATNIDMTIWVAALYLIVQMLEGNLLVPRIHSQYLNLHPTIILILLVLGGNFAGLWGVILVIPLAAVAVQLYKYIVRSIQEEKLRRG